MMRIIYFISDIGIMIGKIAQKFNILNIYLLNSEIFFITKKDEWLCTCYFCFVFVVLFTSKFFGCVHNQFWKHLVPYNAYYSKIFYSILEPYNIRLLTMSIKVPLVHIIYYVFSQDKNPFCTTSVSSKNQTSLFKLSLKTTTFSPLHIIHLFNVNNVIFIVINRKNNR